MLNWSFVRILHCVLFLTFSKCLRDSSSSSSSSSSLHSESVLSISPKPPAWRWGGGGKRSCSNWVGVGVLLRALWWVGFSSVVVRSIVFGEKNLLVSAVCSLSAAMCLFCQIFQFSWHTLSCWFREALSEEPGLWRKTRKWVFMSRSVQFSFSFKIS